MEEIDMRTISKEKYLEAGQVFHWFTRRQITLWFTGREGRHKRTEVMLPRLVKMGKLTATKYRQQLVYSVPRRNKKRISGNKWYWKIKHGLGCTEGLVRFYLADPDCEIIAERHFRGWYIFPEWGIRYSKTGTLLMFEYCTKDNWSRPGVIRSKITRYKKVFHKFAEKFEAKACLVVFVANAPRWTVEKFVRKILPCGPEFVFTDLQTFMDTPIGDQLTAPIYIWGEDGKKYALRKDDD
jgi:hypothetical protein